MAILVTKVVSGRLSRLIARMIRGTTSKPTATRPTKNAANLPLDFARVPAESPVPDEIAVRTAIRRIAIRSSTISIPITSSRSCPLMPCSSNALAMIVVLEIAMIAPAKMLSRVVQPKARPAMNPSQTMMLDWITAAARADRRSARQGCSRGPPAAAGAGMRRWSPQQRRGPP